MSLQAILNKINNLLSKVSPQQRQKVMQEAPRSMKEILNMDKALKQNGIPTTRINQKPEKVVTTKRTYYQVRYMSNLQNKSVEWAIISDKPSFDTVSGIQIFGPNLQPAIELGTIPKFPPHYITHMLIDYITRVPGIPTKSSNAMVVNESLQLEGINLKGVDWYRWLSYLSLAASVALNLMMIYAIARVIYQKVDALINEKYAAIKAEEQLNQSLFGSQTGNEPAFNIYSSAIQAVEQVIRGSYNGCILCGPPGMSKTYIVRRTLYFNHVPPSKYAIVKGASLDLAGIYAYMFQNKNKILIFDDFDRPLKDPEVINMMKAALDSYSQRMISLPQPEIAKQNMEGRLPNQFTFKGRLILITNLNKSDLDLALISRAPVIEINFDTKQMIQNLQNMLKYIAPDVDMKIKQEVLDYVIYVISKHPEYRLDFRKFKACIDARLGNPQDWQNMVIVILAS